MIWKIVSPASLGAALREERKKKGMNQTEAGQRVGVDQSTVSKVEQGNAGTRMDTLFRLLSVLELELVLQPRQKYPGEGEGEDW